MWSKTTKRAKNEKPKWVNLKNNKCPSCNGDFTEAEFDKIKRVFTCPCGFKISHIKMIKIVSDHVKKGL